MLDCLHVKGVNQPSPIESTYTDGCTYPDPTSFCTQTLPNYGDALPTSSHHYGPYFQTSGSRANEVQRDALPTSSHHYGPYFQTSGSRANEVQQDDPFAGDEYWSKQSWDADQLQYFADLDPFPEATENSAIQSDPQGESQLSTGAVGQTREAFPYTASTFRQGNVPAQSTNTVASDSIYSVSHPFGYATEYISYPEFPPDQPFRGTSSYLPESSSPYTLSHATQTALQNFRPSNTSFGNPTDQIPVNRGLENRNRGSQLSATKRKQQSRKRAAAAPPLRRSHRTRLPRATTTSAAGTSGTSTVLGRKKAELGAAMGSDYRLRAEVRVENGLLLGLVDNQWSMSV